MWDAEQYLKFEQERARPFLDLLVHVRRERVSRAADLGCGAGNLTRTLADRWPAAAVVGVDNSPEMLAKAKPLAIPGRLAFLQADIAHWRSAEPLDLVVSNAALQWVGNHEQLLPALARMLAPGGTLAVQMPKMDGMPARRVIAEVASSARWRDRLQGVGLQPGSVQPLVWYAQLLRGVGMAVDAWETTYVHILTGSDPVVEWMKGTALRPLLDCLGPGERADFLAELGAELQAVYRPVNGETFFPFPRIFLVATL
jgi:trans-aconitate 2-methyltransferase